MKIRIILFLFTISISLNAQISIKPFGKVDLDELKMTSYEKDMDAQAVILFDHGDSYFYESENGYDIRFTRHKRIKIFDKSAIAHAEVKIPFYVDGYGRTEVVKSIKARTYNYKNGNILIQELDPSTIYDEKVSENWVYRKFVFPNVQEGSVLELEYVLESPFHFNLPDWTFQDKIPTIYSEYQVKMIPFYEYIYIAQGIDRFDVQNSELSDYKRSWGNTAKSYGQQVGNGIEFQDNIYTFGIKDIPSFKDESFITSINDYIIKMDFQLAKFHSPNGQSKDIITTWQALNEDLIKDDNFGKFIKGSSKISSKILSTELNLSGKSTTSKSQTIIEYVRQHFTWNNINSKYAYQNPRKFFELKTGNSAEINLFLISMLNEAGIPATPVLLSTRNHGKINSNYPFSHFLNYVAVLVNTAQPFLTDATEDKTAYNRIPMRCLNGMGLLVNEAKEPQWVRLYPVSNSINKNVIKIDVEPEKLVADVELSVQSTEYEAFRYRNNLLGDNDRIKENFEKHFNEIYSVNSFNYEKSSLPYSMTIQGNKEVEGIGDKLVINPFLNLSLQKNPFSQIKRDYPVDFIYPNSEEFNISLTIPDGYKIVDLPKEFKMENDIAKVNIEFNQNNKLLEINGIYHFKKSVYRSNEYSRLRAYIDYIVKYFNQEIILEKA